MNEFSGLELLATSVIVLDEEAKIVFANAATENLLERPCKSLLHVSLTDLFINGDQLQSGFREAIAQQFSDKRQELVLESHWREPLHVHCTVIALDHPTYPVLIELRENVKQIKHEREERIHDQNRENKELIRNLAHEIKNPLGGIRGAAQLLELELPEYDEKSLREYTKVIVKEADRLQILVDRLLAPNRTAQVITQVNIHEICEHVLRLIQAEYSQGLRIIRDYDLSIPEFSADYQQLIQVTLNIAQNAAQALKEKIANSEAQLTFKTRVVRQTTIIKQRYKLALDLQIIDNGPGISPEINDRIFYPLVTGREGGTGLGLTLAQAFISQHSGIIECESKTGCTVFKILIPLS